MRCFHVLVHGRLSWVPGASALDEVGTIRPSGFYAHRYVLAGDEAGAAEVAVRRVRTNLDSQLGWVSKGFVTVQFSAEEVTDAPMHKLLKPDNRGHTFYSEE